MLSLILSLAPKEQRDTNKVFRARAGHFVLRIMKMMHNGSHKELVQMGLKREYAKLLEGRAHYL
jgi:hypothetical protein